MISRILWPEISQLKKHAPAHAHCKKIDISSFRTRGGAEVDFIVTHNGEVFALEVKVSEEISDSEINGRSIFSNHYKKAAS